MSVEILTSSENIELPEGAETKVRTRGGLSDWRRAAQAIGQRSLSEFLDIMDPGNPAGGKNAHQVIAARIEALGLPGRPYVLTTVKDFAANPARYIEQAGSGAYYFASIRPGTHLAHAEDPAEVAAFVRSFADSHPDAADQNQEIFLTNNGEVVLSGHIVVRDDGEPNAIYAEFTNHDYASFHHGLRVPEVVVRRREHRFQWHFYGDLETKDGSWRDNEPRACNGNVQLTRPQIAQKIFSAIQCVPHDGDAYLPGYYEVLLEQTHGAQTRPVFIEAITSKVLSEYL